MKQYLVYEKENITKELLDSIEPNDSIKINTWKRPLKVIAVSENFIIMWKKHFDTYVYSILEKNKRGHEHNLCYRPNVGYMADEFVCGPDDHYGKYEYNNVEECKKALEELESGELEVSTRHGWGLWHLEIKKGTKDK